jgi:hypothetical protein
MSKPANKKTSLQDLDLNVQPENPEAEEKEDEDEGFILTKWLKDRVKTGKKKMVEVEE